MTRGAPERLRLTARLSLFGVSSKQAELDVTPRPRARRATRAVTTLAVALVAAAVAAIIPPHVPWLIGVLAIGAWRARAEWRGELDLHAFEGECPRCGAALKLEERHVTLPLPIPCYACHAQPMLSLPAA